MMKPQGTWLRSPLRAAAVVVAAALSCAGDMKMNVVKDHQLEGDKWRAYNEIREYWIKNVFPQCASNNHLTLSCDGCEYIYIIVRITIDANGKLAGYVKIDENVCGKAAPQRLERCFMEYLESITFPKQLRRMVIEANLGNGLKC